jgi:AcrR family transcriptional regulator
MSSVFGRSETKAARMYHIKDDQRSIRSSEMLCEGLAKLIREKDFASITVTDLVEAAKVGRTTFYRNFDEIEDVLRLRCDQVFEGLVSYLQNYRKQPTHEASRELIKPILRYFYLHSEIIELLIIANRRNIFQDSFRKLLDPFKSMYGTFYNVSDDYVDYIVAVQTGFITNVLTHWIKTGKKQAPDELADNLRAMIRSENSPWAGI